NLSDSRSLPVVARNPVAFLDTVTSPASVDVQHCPLSGTLYSGGPLPLALNADGSRNTCFNPASAGSVVRIFLDGLGITDPAPVTGSSSPAAVPLNLPMAVNTGTIVSAVALPGAIAGIWEIDLSFPATTTGATPVSLSIDSIPVRDGNLTLWFH